MTHALRLAVVAATVLSLAGCGILFPSAKERAAKNSPDFRSGYTDGCASATTQDTNYRHDQVRDEGLYKSSKDYRSGWSSGFYNCRTNYTHEATTPGVGPIPDNSPGSHPY
jgi:predicted small lipoprotein YifL